MAEQKKILIREHSSYPLDSRTHIYRRREFNKQKSEEILTYLDTSGKKPKTIPIEHKRVAVIEAPYYVAYYQKGRTTYYVGLPQVFRSKAFFRETPLLGLEPPKHLFIDVRLCNLPKNSTGIITLPQFFGPENLDLYSRNILDTLNATDIYTYEKLGARHELEMRTLWEFLQRHKEIYLKIDSGARAEGLINIKLLENETWRIFSPADDIIENIMKFAGKHKMERDEEPENFILIKPREEKIISFLTAIINSFANVERMFIKKKPTSMIAETAMNIMTIENRKFEFRVIVQLVDKDYEATATYVKIGEEGSPINNISIGYGQPNNTITVMRKFFDEYAPNAKKTDKEEAIEGANKKLMNLGRYVVQIFVKKCLDSNPISLLIGKLLPPRDRDNLTKVKRLQTEFLKLTGFQMDEFYQYGFNPCLIGADFVITGFDPETLDITFAPLEVESMIKFEGLGKVSPDQNIKVVNQFRENMLSFAEK